MNSHHAQSGLSNIILALRRMNRKQRTFGSRDIRVCRKLLLRPLSTPITNVCPVHLTLYPMFRFWKYNDPMESAGRGTANPWQRQQVALGQTRRKCSRRKRRRRDGLPHGWVLQRDHPSRCPASPGSTTAHSTRRFLFYHDRWRRQVGTLLWVPRLAEGRHQPAL